MVASDPIILPTCLLEVKDDLSIARLPHPRTRLPALFAIRAGQGIWEIQSVVSPPTSGRSWFFEPIREDQPDQLISQQAGRLLVVTPFDPFFLLLGLFLGQAQSDEQHNPFAIDKKNGDHRARFEEIETILERAQAHWLFAESAEGPTAGDVELFTNEAFHDKHLTRIFAPLHQEEQGCTLWRLEGERIVQEIERKIDHLASAGLEAGRDARTIWTRLGSKEGLFDFEQTPNNLSIIKDIYNKIALEIIQAYLPSTISEHLRGMDKYAFAALKKEKEKQAQRSMINPLEIGRGSQGSEAKTTKGSAKPPPAKRKKADDSLKPPPKITLHQFFPPQVP
ncbi:hypothetical protein PTTG_03271 [Puccinia triticina 1-1 BBBD Race 1]|uniref:Ydr279_N domain-containing protein n=1 Tax=Puccinia triticina (isolate 1-1 / race 1 (BBBD)) TaxID=630390 RepID=A0A180GHQ7_PUCT1|nr:hypothetical protein PTTG_03271 [Puccinia triticina 1-1 BBBD Race 1]WAR57191.1 hypothetical protein PtB15_8B238 [Puccinia triticina]